MWSEAGWALCGAGLLLLLALHNLRRGSQVQVVAVPRREDPAPQILIVRNTSNTRQNQPSTSSDPGNTQSNPVDTENTVEISDTTISQVGRNPETSCSSGNTRSGHPSGSDSNVDSGYGQSRRDFGPHHSHSVESFNAGSFSGTPTIDIIRNPIRNFTFPKVFDPSTTHKVASEVRLNHPGIPKLPLPEEWLHKRPFNVKYTTIVRPLTQLNPVSGADIHNQESRVKKLSATRSPSLEKDDKSPFLESAKSEDSEVFGFDSESVKKLEGAIMSEKMTPKEMDDKTESPTSLRRYRSVSTRLNMCSVTETPENQDIPEISPKILECSSAKEKSTATRFQFSPKVLAETMASPRFFTPPETVSPMFFAEPSPKSVYYDTVRSPKFFADTPREDIVPQSPKALGDHFNRNGVEKPTSKPSSPRILGGKPSPKIHSYNKENYFTFEHVMVAEGSENRISPKPRKYGGRNSLERERCTQPADIELRKYRRHNSCDTNQKNVDINIAENEGVDNKETETNIGVSRKESIDVVDCCAQMDALRIEDESIRSAQSRRHRLKSISLDSDNARIIEQNLGLPIAKQIKQQLNEAYKKDVGASCEGIGLQTLNTETPAFEFDESTREERNSPDLKKKALRQSCDPQSFLDMPRFSPKEFEITITTEEGATMSADTQMKKKGKNLRNLTIDLTKRDSDLEKELQELEKLYTDTEEKKVKTPTLKVKATSLDSSEAASLSLPQQNTLEVPQNSISVPNTPKRQLKRLLAQRGSKSDICGGKFGYSSIQGNERRLYMKGQDSGIFLRENHAALMLYQPGTSRMGSRTMGSFDENTTDFAENPPEINVSGEDYPAGFIEPVHLGTNLLNYKQNLSVSNTNLKTLPEGVPSDDFEPSAEDEKLSKKLHRRNSNQSILLSTHSLQSSNCSLSSSGTSCHNLVRTSISNFSLNSESRKRLSIDRRDSHSSSNADNLTLTNRVACSSNTNFSETSKNCLLQRRGSNNSLTLTIGPTNDLSRHSSNSSLNKEAKTQKKGLLERRSSNTSLTLNIHSSNAQLSVNRPLSISNYNLDGSFCNLSRYNSNFSIDNPTAEPKKGILERRASNTSLTLNIPQEPRDLDIDETLIEPLKDLPNREKHRKSLSTENLLPKSYKNRNTRSTDKPFGSHDNLWSNQYEQDYPQNLTYVCGDQENEIIYAVGSQDIENFQQGVVRNITTKPLSPQTTSEDFRLYLANMQHLQNASSVLSRQQLQDLNEVFQNGYSKVQCHSTAEGQHSCPNRVVNESLKSPGLPEPCSEYQKTLLRNLHQEFWDMPTNFQEKPIVSGSHPKNRYKTILPNEHSRFILNPDAGPCEGYINANFIKGHEYSKNSYVATQGPLQNTIYDFWLMVFQNNQNFYHQRAEAAANNSGVQKVVMLTNFIENNRQKCEKYFPLELNEEINFDSPSYTESTMFFEDSYLLKNIFTIKNVGMVNKPGYTIRKLNVKYKRGVKNESDVQNENAGVESETASVQSETARVQNETVSVQNEITVHHYWFHNWADHKCPKDVSTLLNLSLDILKDNVHNFDEKSPEHESTCQCDSAKSYPTSFVFPPLEDESNKCEMDFVKKDFDVNFTQDQSPPVIIHCSAGIGRTGCLIAILNGIKQLANEEKVDVLGIVCNMRLNRGGMVQNSEQYELIHKVLCLFEQLCLNL